MFNISQIDRAFNRGMSQSQTKELKEAYLDIETFDSRLWMRIGRQSIVWGKTELFRVIDQFNPQDLALASLPSLEESRIPMWAFRGVYSLYDVGPLDDVRIEAAFNFDENNSNAILNEFTGAYLSGAESNVIDTIVLTDDGCEGEAAASVDVVGDPVVEPGIINIPPGACVQFEALNGSGDFNWLTLSVDPVGELSATGFYLAGSEEGEDLLRVEDAITGRIFDFEVGINSETLIRSTTRTLLMTTGSTYALPVESGSGVYETAVDGQSVSVTDGVASAESLGSTTLVINDAIVGCIGGEALEDHPEVVLEVEVTQSLNGPTQVGGGGQRGSALAPGDLNGDGYPDALLGVPWSNFGGVNSGAVFVYPGSQSGFDQEAIEVIHPGIKSGLFGREMAVGDVNGDGHLDLSARDLGGAACW